uniref:Retrotransposon Copia-like N-terminal domain-containing protein n=1 Tax=Ananas comosus var. bracteatus TaxID=296719 RepID=A0A6V7PXX2_ANACO|nr:unnamed protein product [Ananas comosus var. bracteatus]
MAEDGKLTIFWLPQNLFSHESDSNTGMKLTIILLNGFNYVTWSRAASIALGGKSKLGYIDGKSQQNNASLIFELKHDITRAKQGDKSFIERLGTLKAMWDELNLYQPLITDLKTLQKCSEEKIFQLLANLKSEYESLRSQILMSLELPSLNSVCAIIQREETRKRAMNLEPKHQSEFSETSAFAALKEKNEYKKPFHNDAKGTSRNRGQSGRPPPRCDHCNAIGHIKDRCWVLHPHLKPYRSKGRDNDNRPIAQVASSETHISVEKLTQLLQHFSKSVPSSTSPSTQNSSSSKTNQVTPLH